MSDTTRPGRDELERTMTTRLSAAAPNEPGADALGRVRVRAERLATDRTSTTRPWRRPAVRFALATVVAVIAVGASVAVISRPGDVAFARDKLLAQLSPSGTVLHYTERQQANLVAEVFGRSSWVTETWIDAERAALRTETRGDDGELQSIRVESDGRARHISATLEFDGNGELIESDATVWMMMEASAANPLAGSSDFNPLWWLDRMREAVALGDAKIARTLTVDGERCWKLEWTYVPETAPEALVHFSATVRQSDYRPVEHETVIEHRGREVERYATRIESWELLPAASVDAALFSRTALGAGLDVTTENRIYSPDDLDRFELYDAWWLGSRFEGRTLAGQPTYSEDGSKRAWPELYYNRITDGTGLLPFAESGELVLAYSASGADTDAPDDVRVIVIPQLVEDRLPGLLGGAAQWRETGGRRYVEGAEGPQSVALLNLGNATVYVKTPDTATTARAVAALVKAN